MHKEEEVAGGVFYVLGLGFLSSLSSLPPLSLLASVGAFVVGCGCAQGGGMLWVFAVCALFLSPSFFLVNSPVGCWSGCVVKAWLLAGHGWVGQQVKGWWWSWKSWDDDGEVMGRFEMRGKSRGKAAGVFVC